MGWEGVEPCLPPGPWETEPREKLGRTWAEESDFGRGRLAPDSLVILEDKDLQGACYLLSHWLWGWGDECVDMSGPGIASLCPLGSSPAGNLVMDIRHA